MSSLSNSVNNQPMLVVFLENGGHVGGIDLPAWAAQVLDWSTEEYGKLAVRLQAHRHYRRIVVLEDRAATAAALWQALIAASDATVDVLLLVHGQPGYACGCADHRIGEDFFDGLRRLRIAGQARFRLRAVYQMNCYGESLAAEWLSIGAQAVNGAVGVNWLPEPSLSVFLANWLGGQPFGLSVERSYRAASRLLSLVWRPQPSDRSLPHEKIASSRMQVFGDGALRST